MTRQLLKNAIAFTSVLLVLALAACGGSSESDDDLATSSAEEAGVAQALAVRAPVATCGKNATVGAWENVTAPQAPLTGLGLMGPILSDPTHPATLFVSADGAGFFKTTNCGDTWVRVDDPQYGFANPAVSPSGAWTMVINPTNPQIIFANNGYNKLGLFKSTNGGVDWKQAYGPQEMNLFPYAGFTDRVAIDPTDPQHLVAAPHFVCENGHTRNCLLETKNGGTTWTIAYSATENGNHGGGLDMISSTRWLWSVPFDGLYLTSNAGRTWTKVYAGDARAGLYRSLAKGGAYYLPSAYGVLRSTDGVTWGVIPGSPQTNAITGDGSKLYATLSFTASAYFTASETAPNIWTGMAAPQVAQGGSALFADPTNHMLYSSNGQSGIWRMRTK